MTRATLTTALALIATGPAIAQAPAPLQVIAGAAQGGRGDLVLLHGGTIEGVHVIQGGTFDCNDATEPPPCPVSGIRSLSLNLDIGAGDSIHRGVLSFNFDVGRQTVIFDGHKHRRIVVGRHIDLYGDVVVHGRIRRR